MSDNTYAFTTAEDGLSITLTDAILGIFDQPVRYGEAGSIIDTSEKASLLSWVIRSSAHPLTPASRKLLRALSSVQHMLLYHAAEAKRAAVAATPKPTFGPGDIFYTSGGYEQTRVSFYQVVSVTPSGKSVRVLPITKRQVSGDGHCWRVVPRAIGALALVVLAEDGSPDNTPRLKRLNYHAGEDGWHVSIKIGYDYAWPWDGTSKSESGYH